MSVAYFHSDISGPIRICDPDTASTSVPNTQQNVSGTLNLFLLSVLPMAGIY